MAYTTDSTDGANIALLIKLTQTNGPEVARNYGTGTKENHDAASAAHYKAIESRGVQMARDETA